jgi:glycine/D-amino acid oxidase-like deaminating enzyme
VLEQGTVASRASGRNDGQLLLGLGEHYHRIHGQFGETRARLLWDFLRDNHEALRQALAENDVDCELDQSGGLRLAETPHEWTELQEAAALLSSEHKPHALVPAGELARWLPAAPVSTAPCICPAKRSCNRCTWSEGSLRQPPRPAR